MFTKAQYKTLIDIYNGPQEDLPAYLAEASQAIQETIKRIKYLNESLEKCRIDYEDKKTSIKRELDDAQKCCHHFFTEYNQDPSGNNDGYVTCSICGKTLDRFERAGYTG